MNKLTLTLFFILIICFKSNGQSTYENSNYYYKVEIPTGWSLVGEIKNDSINNFSIVEWTLPIVISKSTGNEIEDSVEIYACKNDSIKSIEELLQHEKGKWAPYLLNVNISQVESKELREIMVSSKIDSFDHQAKIFLIYKNGICYRIQFVSKLETFDENLPVFNKFYDRLKI